MAQMNISNTLFNDDSSGVISYAEQLSDRLIKNYINTLRDVDKTRLEEAGFPVDSDVFQKKLNEFFLKHWVDFQRFLKEEGVDPTTIDSWHEVQEFLRGLPDDEARWLQTKIASLEASIANIDHIDGGAFDISSANNVGGVFATFSGLGTALTAVPALNKKSGMAVRFIKTDTNEYEQYRYNLKYEDTTAGNAAFLNIENWVPYTDVEAGDVVGDPVGDWVQSDAEVYIDGKLQDIKNWVSNTPETEVIYVEAADWPLATGQTNRLYRVAGTTSYSEYGWDGTQFILLDIKEYGIDNEPTAGSNNIVKSGGVYPTKEKTDANTEFLSDLGYYNLCFHFDDGGSYAQYARRTQNIELKAGTKYQFDINSVDTTTTTQIILIDSSDNEYTINEGTGDRKVNYTPIVNIVKCAISLRANGQPVVYTLKVEDKESLINSVPSTREMSQDNKSLLSEIGYNKIHFHFDDGGSYSQYARRTENITIELGTTYNFKLSSADVTTRTQIILVDYNNNETTINEDVGNRSFTYKATADFVKCVVSLRVVGQPVEYQLEIVNVQTSGSLTLKPTVDNIVGSVNAVFDFTNSPHSQYSNRFVNYQFINGHSYNLYVSSNDETTPTYFSLRTLSGSELVDLGDRVAGNRVIQFVCTVDNADRLYMSLYAASSAIFNVIIEDKINPSINSVKFNPNFSFKSINHRGFNVIAPENTLPAYILSRKMGYTYVECDIAVTSDGVPVLLHDETIDRTSDGTGSISSMTFEQVRTYDFGSWKSATYAGTKIPSIWEFLQLCKHLGLKPYIEFWDSALTQSIIEKIFNYIDALGMLNDVTIISFSSDILSIVKTVNPNVRLGLNVNSINAENVAVAQSLKLSTNEVFMNTGSSSNSNLLDDLDIGLEIWVVNTFTGVNNALMNVRCAGMTSDYYQAEPIILQKYNLF